MAAIKYHEPSTVLSPAKYIDSVDVLYDGGPEGYSLAHIKWEGVSHVGIRWNVSFKERDNVEMMAGKIICNGSPCKNNTPSWFILPRELFHPDFFEKDDQLLKEVLSSFSQNDTQQ